ncbi:hypothetical protein QBC43DRAFT_292494 [Cladorrhinum sp. PSN259]|nr:hypothetical protein QBC43DRAFT_292494 [Cladorrhinum sp. PSN259]
MKSLTILLQFLLLLPATPVLAGPERSYCGGQGQKPNRDNCVAAINKINANTRYSGGAKFDAGDCTVEYKSLTLNTSPRSILGSVFKAQAMDIVTDGCGASGWCKDAGGNVTVHQCRVCLYGTCSVCNAPKARSILLALADEQAAALEDRGAAEKEEEGESAIPVPSPTTKSAVVTRRQVPAPGVTCSSSNNGVPVSQCVALANSVRGQSLRLPFLRTSGNCDLAIFGITSSLSANGNTVADRIVTTSNLCKSSGSNPVVGFQTDDTQLIPLAGYTIWFGNLCGTFSWGVSTCIPSNWP